VRATLEREYAVVVVDVRVDWSGPVEVVSGCAAWTPRRLGRLLRVSERGGAVTREYPLATLRFTTATLAWFDEGRRVVPDGTQLALVTDHCPATR
jgi:hypothetical protein